ncbi:hypothetical protein Vadar_022890 [Vaccinium darrowii]|uniref:Uncharacterized protein n=1 Tax=Vaccinium darrowii TaxID=229202 RepID=A0ACB7XBM8_9ERIC|nr:hypothetical protein Vadar_022890 [Vaccinium darrowii]
MTLCFEILDAVMVEKILRIQPNVKKLFLLIRANDANSATQRLHNEVTGTALFSVLREKCGQDYFNSFILEKLIPVPGDVACEDLRVEDGGTREELWSQIDVIVQLTLMKAFVCGERKGVILERPFTMGETLNGTSGLDIRVEKRLMEEKLRDLRTENVTEKTATLAMKNFGIQRTMDVFAVGVGKGKLRCLLFDPETVADMIPGDMVVNSMLVAIAVNANQYRQIMIYHVGSSLRNPLRYPSIQLYGFRYFTKNPWIDRRSGNPVKVHKLRVFSNMASYQKYVTIHYLMPLKVMKLLDVALCHYLQGTYIAQERKIKFLLRLVELYMPYLFSKGIFDDGNTEKLRMEAREAGGEGVFNFDPKIIDWEEYFMNIHFPGVVKYLF